jgi:hypothetical protein
VMVGIIDSGGDSSDRPRTSSTRTSSTTSTVTATSTSDTDKRGSATAGSGASSDSSSSSSSSSGGGTTDSIYQGRQALTRLGFGPHAIGSRTVACRLMDRDGKVMI